MNGGGDGMGIKATAASQAISFILRTASDGLPVLWGKPSGTASGIGWTEPSEI